MCIKSGPEAILGSQNDAILTKAKAEIVQQLAPFEIKPECKKFTGNYIIRLTYIIVFLLYNLTYISHETFFSGSCSDATQEEVFHVITQNGHSIAYPKVFGEAYKLKSTLQLAMDKARYSYKINTYRMLANINHDYYFNAILSQK